MPWYLYIALKQLFPTGRRFPFFTAISVLGVALGVALLVISTSVMGGFGYEIRKMIVDTQGDVQLRADEPMSSGRVDDPELLMESVARVPGVVAVTPFAEGTGMLQFNSKPTYPVFRGIDVNTVEKVIPIARYVHPIGSLDDLDDDSIVVSSLLATSIGARVGDEVTIYSPRMMESALVGEAFLPRRLRVAGIFEIGHQALDNSLVLVTLRRMQDLYNLGGAVHGLSVKSQPGADTDELAVRINGQIAPGAGVRARSWMESNQDFLWVLQLERNMIFFLLTFIIIVAAFSVTSSLLISVVRKTREIGLLGALGAESRHVALSFCFQGFFIGTAGTVVGLAGGFAALAMRNTAIDLFTRLTASEAVLERFYQFRNLPAHWTTADILTIATCSVVISTLAGLLPAWRAARLKPVDALRSE